MTRSLSGTGQPDLTLSSSLYSPSSVPTSSEIFTAMSSLESSDVLSPPHDARVGLTWSSSSNVTSWRTGTRRLRRSRAPSSLPATLRSVRRRSSMAGVTNTMPTRELTMPSHGVMSNGGGEHGDKTDNHSAGDPATITKTGREGSALPIEPSCPAVLRFTNHRDSAVILQDVENTSPSPTVAS